MVLKNFGLLFLFVVTVTSSVMARDYVPGILVVKMRAGYSPYPAEISIQSEANSHPTEVKALPASFKPHSAKPRISASSVTSEPKTSEDTTYILNFAKNADMESLAKDYAGRAGVIWAEPNYKAKTVDPTGEV